MALSKLQDFFGDDWGDALDSIKSAPGAFGNILVGVARQVRFVDAAALVLVLAGWAWLAVGYGLIGDHRLGLLLLSLLPTALWFGAGIAGGLIFEIGGIGLRSLAYWEAYFLILLCGVFGVISLRLALNPRDRRVYHGAPATDA